MRINLAVPFKTRTTAPDKDAKLKNAYIEVRNGQSIARKRPIAKLMQTIGTGTAQGGIGITIGGVDYLYSVNGDTGSLNDSTVINGYSKWNPFDKGSGITLSGGNLVATLAAGSSHAVRAFLGASPHKWYWEITLTTSKYLSIGVANASASLISSLGTTVDGGNSLVCNFNGYILKNNVIVGTLGTSLFGGEVLCMKHDSLAGTVEFKVNAGAWKTISGGNVPTGDLYPAVGGQGNPASTVTANFGASSFVYSIPSGYTGVLL